MKIFAASKKTPNLMHFMGLLRFFNIFFQNETTYRKATCTGKN